MTNFWPSGIELNDTQSPMEILEEAKRDWESSSNGLMTLVLQSTKSQSGNDIILVHAKHLPSNRTASLFSVVHRPTNPYPVAIQQEDDELPKFLKKTYYQPGHDPVKGLSLPLVLGKIEGHTVKNEWVSDTPSEFREKLQEVFNLGSVKGKVLNLACKVSATDVNEENGCSNTETQ